MGLVMLRATGLICAALVAGLTLSHFLQAPGSSGLPGAAWLEVQQSFYGGFAVVGGLAEILGLLATGAAGVVLLRRNRRAASAHLVAALCLAGTLLSFAIGNQPVNERVASWTVATLPENWTMYRDRWEAAHATSAALSLTALVVLVVAAVGGSPTAGDRARAST